MVVVDDVLTTGATLAAAGAVLSQCGFHTVHGVVLAHTPAIVGESPVTRVIRG